MSSVLSEEKKQHVIALGKLGWPLRRIAPVDTCSLMQAGRAVSCNCERCFSSMKLILRSDSEE